MSVKISIIIPVYNGERLLPRCLDSIIAQSYDDYEIILIDDGSKDQSGKICDEYALRNNKIRVLHKTNGGVSSARNYGLDFATGQWVFLSDADDELYPDALQNLASCITENTALVSGCFIKDDQQMQYLNKGNMTKQEILRWIICGNPYYDGYLWDKLFNVNIIKTNNIRFDEEIKFGEDRLFIVDYICKSKGEFIHIDQPIYHYYECTGGAMQSTFKGFNPNYITDLNATEKIIHLLSACGEKSLIQDAKEVLWKTYRFMVREMKKWDSYDYMLDRQMKDLIFTHITFFDNLYFHFKYKILMRVIRIIKKIRKH